MSESTAYLPDFSSITRPIAIPATGALRGTPASIIASEPPHTAQLDPDRADFVELAAVEPHAVREHLLAEHLFLELFEDVLRLELAFDFALWQRGHQIVQHLVDAVVVLELAADPHRFGQRHEHFFLDLAVEVVADLLPRDGDFLLADLTREIVDG